MQSINWTNDQLVPSAHDAIGLSGSPAATVFHGQIYLFHQGRNNDGRIWYATFNGQNWSQDRALAGGTYYGIQDSPAVTVFNNRLCLAYHDADGHLRMGGLDGAGNWFNDASLPAYGISYSPSIAVYNHRLYLAYQGSGANAGKLMFTSTDGASWTPEQCVLDISMLGAPALVVYQNELHCFHKGTNETIDPSKILLLDSYLELLPIDDPWVTLPLELTIAVVEELSGLGDVKMAAQAGMLVGEIISKATSRKGDWLWHTVFNGSGWEQDVLCPSAQNAYGINSEFTAVTEYGNRLFCARQGRDSSYLWCGIFGSKGWHRDTEIGQPGNTFCTTGAPALVVFNGSLYCFHQGKDDSGWLWMTNTTIQPLSLPTPAPAPATQPTPAATPTNPALSPLVFDAAFYLNTYADLRNAFGNNLTAAQNHWLTYGIGEGRQGCARFHSQYYLANNPDVANAYGPNNYAGAIQHFMTYGKNENRRCVSG